MDLYAIVAEWAGNRCGRTWQVLNKMDYIMQFVSMSFYCGLVDSVPRGELRDIISIPSCATETCDLWQII